MNFIDEKCMSVVTLLINNPENILSINFIMRCVIEMKKDEVIVLKHSLEEKLQVIYPCGYSGMLRQGEDIKA